MFVTTRREYTHTQLGINKLCKETQAGIKVEGEKMMVLKNSDNITVLTKNDVLEEAMAKVSRSLQNYYIKTNTGETKILIHRKT